MEPVATPRTFQGRYEVTHLIARGGMAQVYRALDTRLGRHVALKVLFPELSIDRAFVERFRREAQAAANLSHPNVVDVYDFGEDDGTYFIVMELVTGTSLATALRSEKSMPASRAATIAAQVAAALSYAHRSGVVHRDIKPGNVLLTDDGQVKVTDFGIAQAISTEEGLTMAGSVMGTAAYFSPEQAEGAVVDGRSDVYSLGVVLYEMLAGRPPFSGDSPVAVASMHVRNEPPVLRDLNPAVPEAIEAVTMRALRKSPAQRYQSAEELRADLVRFSGGQPVLAEERGAPVSAGVGATSVLAEVGATSVLPADTGTTTTVPARDTTLVVPAVAPVTPVPAQPVVSEPVPPPAAPVAAIDVPPRDVARTRRSTKEAAWIVVALLVAVVVAAFFVARALAGPTTLSMPNVVGKTQGSASTLLTGQGFFLNAPLLRHSKVQQGYVINQQPKASATVKPGAHVTLVVSLGPVETVQVPQVTGRSLLAAQTLLASKGLAYKLSPTQQWSSPVVPDSVLAQSIPAGTTVNSDQKVILTVLAPNGTYPVPDVTNDPSATAGSTLAQFGLTVGSTTTQCSTSVAQGLVISTSPAATKPVQAGTPVDLVLSSGGCPVRVPNLFGLTEPEAQQAVQNVGLVVSFTQDPCAPGINSSGLVAGQNPAFNESVSPGQTIIADIGCATAVPPPAPRNHLHGHTLGALAVRALLGRREP